MFTADPHHRPACNIPKTGAMMNYQPKQCTIYSQRIQVWYVYLNIYHKSSLNVRKNNTWIRNGIIFWGDSLSKPTSGVASAEVAIFCTNRPPEILQLPFHRVWSPAKSAPPIPVPGTHGRGPCVQTAHWDLGDCKQGDSRLVLAGRSV